MFKRFSGISSGKRAIAIALLSGTGCAAPRYKPLVLSPWTPLTTRPASLPASRPSVSVSEMTVQTLSAQNFFFEATRTTPLDVQRAIDRMTADLATAANEGKVSFTGPCIFVFHGRSTELRRPFTLEIGFPVAEGTRPFDHFQLKKLAAFHCAAVTFIGPGSSIDKAYDKLDPAVDAARLRRTDEVREVYVNWQGPDFPNDQILVGAGVQ